MALAVDASGAAYIAGFTESFNLPAVNAGQSFNAGGNDAFVAKLSPSGNTLMYCTYLGGSADDRAIWDRRRRTRQRLRRRFDHVEQLSGRAALQAKLTGSRNAFIVKLNPAGNGLVYGTYLGGNASDSANGIAVDAVGFGLRGGRHYVVQLSGDRLPARHARRAGRVRGQAQSRMAHTSSTAPTSAEAATIVAMAIAVDRVGHGIRHWLDILHRFSGGKSGPAK